MKKGFYYIIISLVLFLLWSCSTQKNTKASRSYHAINTRYNIYYNGKTSFDEALRDMQDQYQESYTEMLLFHPVSAQPKDKDEPGGAFDRAIEKSNKGIKLHSIKAKPPKKPGWKNNPKQRAFQEQEEYNPFMKHCWLLMGQAHFYNADFLQGATTFSYLARHYAHDPQVVSEAKLWQARCYIEMGWLFEAEDILKKQNINGIPDKNLKLYAQVYANYLINNGQFEEGVTYLQTAIKAEKNKKQRSRLKYLLGQLYASMGADQLAYQAFGSVIRSNPAYELEFAARIRQTEVYAGNDPVKMTRKLERMAKSEKNKDYQDQVYYALGNVWLNQKDTTNAIFNYERAIEKSTRDGIDKAICQIKLGDLYFIRKDYIKAQPCFSGAAGILDKEYKDYKRIAKLSSVLDELVVYVEAVQLQDSLQTLSRMPEAERLAVIDKIIEKVIKEEEEEKKLAEREAYLAEQEAMGSGIDRPGTEGTTVGPITSGGAGFYFYNAQAVSQGKTQFQRKWGRRTLEDDWRRRNKDLSTFLEQDGDIETIEERLDDFPQFVEDLAATDPLQTDLREVLSDDPKTREYYLQQIPFTEEEIEASNLIIIDGLYHMAMIYKDKLEDFTLSIDAFETLERRYPENEHRLENYYQVYLMALRMQDQSLASLYKSKLLSAYPTSDYAIAIADPNYEYNIRRMDHVQDSIYEMTYNRYLSGDIYTVRKNYREMSETYPLANLLPKFMFLEALSYVQEGDPEGFKEALKALLEKYPDADVSELAGEMLKGVLRGRQMVQGDVRGMVWKLRFGGEDGEFSEEDAGRIFSSETQTPYRMLLFFPTESLDKNQLLFAVAAYNFSNFMVKQLDLSLQENGPLTILAIDGFVNFEEIRQYYKMVFGTEGYGAALGSDVTFIPISEENYEILMRGKTVDEYTHFFEETFGEVAPDIVNRWDVHRNELEEEDEGEDEDGTEEFIYGSEPDEEELIQDEEPLIEEVVPLSGEEKEEETRIDEPENKEEEEEIPEEEIQELPLLENENVPVVSEPAEERFLTLRDIEEIRRKEAEEEAARKEEMRKRLLEKQEEERLLLAEKEKEREEVLKKQKEEDEAILRAKQEQEKLQAEKKKQDQATRKAEIKAREQQRKEREKAQKVRLKQREKERKEKEKEYRKKQKEREKERNRIQKERQAAARKK